MVTHTLHRLNSWQPGSTCREELNCIYDFHNFCHWHRADCSQAHWSCGIWRDIVSKWRKLDSRRLLSTALFCLLSGLQRGVCEVLQKEYVATLWLHLVKNSYSHAFCSAFYVQQNSLFMQLSNTAYHPQFYKLWLNFQLSLRFLILAKARRIWERSCVTVLMHCATWISQDWEVECNMLHPLLFILASKKILNQVQSAHCCLLSIQEAQGILKFTKIRRCRFSLFWKSKSHGKMHFSMTKNVIRD